MINRIGIDVGSTTVKVVVVGEKGQLLFRSYERHFSKVREKCCELLEKAKEHLENGTVRVAVTGSAGLGMANSAKIHFVQEVYATAEAVTTFLPGTNAVVELGGEDAKVIFFDGALEERMNGSCAGGTGAFIDQMATLLNVTNDELDELALNHKMLYPIASRCGVFAKTDIQPTLNQGGRKEDVAASIFQAVVDQTIGGLCQGREIVGKVAFLGGPLHFFKGLRDRFKETLKLDDNTAIFPKDGECFAAIGAALCTNEANDEDFQAIYNRIANSVEDRVNSESMPPLFVSEKEYNKFLDRHNEKSPKIFDLNTYSGKAYLGVDAGSTTTKLVLIDENGNLLYKYYSSNQGDPVDVILEQLKEIYSQCGDRVTICGAAATGYGEDLIKSAFSMDLGLVETSAHYTAAAYFDPTVDFIIDIGGQDMKCFKIRNGTVDSIMLNEACSSGCGSFLETFAKALGYQIADFSKMGLYAKNPVNLGSRCTVFMNSSVKQAQKDGATIEDISAGLSVSVVKNAIHKVIRAASADDMGQNIVVQGGTFLNDAVLRSFENEIKRNVTRPTIAGIMGAYGAALSAKNLNLEKSELCSYDELKVFKHDSKSVRCKQCTNNCALTVNSFNNNKKHISGNRCQKGLGKKNSELPNMFKWKYNYLRSLKGKEGKLGKIGIPMGLNFYENLPFWMTLLTDIGFEVVVSEESSRSLYIKGQQTIPSDTVCYPAKLMHGHITSLIEQGIETIFYPCNSYNFDEKISDNNYNCPVVAYYPELIEANMPQLKNVRYLYPYMGIHRQKDFEKFAVKYFKDEFGVDKKTVIAAVRNAYVSYDTYRQKVREQGDEIIKFARENGHKMLVLAGRPYHIDPEVSHGIEDLITEYGFCLLSGDSISHKMPSAQQKVLNQWTFHARMYNAARYVCTQPDMEFVQLVSFGCGTDAITTDEIRSMLESNNKLYTQLKIDEITNLGAVRIRIRSLLAASEIRNAGVK